MSTFMVNFTLMCGCCLISDVVFKVNESLNLEACKIDVAIGNNGDCDLTSMLKI